ncbi:MOG protein, partial [Rhinopomastus cyanomelas]|nr:MOG protein [Rhinopomastus cyanomelas]
ILVSLIILHLQADFPVVGPKHPLLAAVGQDVVLPCRLSPATDTRRLEIRWIRTQFSETVHLYRNGEDIRREQLREYAGRTELDKEGLSSGILDLRISGVRPSDEGQYTCTVQDAHSYGEAMVALEVAGAFFRNTYPWMAALGVSLALSAGLFVSCALLVVKKRAQSRELGESFCPLPPVK